MTHASAEPAGRSQGGGSQSQVVRSNAFTGSTKSNRSETKQRSATGPVTSQSVQQPVIQQSQVRSSRQLNPASVATGRQLTQTEVRSNQQRSQTQYSSNQRQYTQGNNYGGLWFPANSHNDWNHDNQYYWNNHNYGWYNGGWLIIDAGFNPYYENSPYSSGGSTVANVQSSLAGQGYYNGPIDGIYGPGTRNGIANYQSDNGLRATGRINDPLLQSLGLE